MIRNDFVELLRHTIGLDPTSIGSATIERAVASRMTSLGLQQTEDYLSLLHRSTEQLQELIEAVVVPETWFFRDRDAFTALMHLISQRWLPSHATAALRVLSIPCCTGEEPYSLVMALLDGGVAPHRIKVDAVDISAHAIARAKRGVYGSNSFRGKDLDFRNRYFEPSATGYSIQKAVRDLVVFHHENIFSTTFRTGVAPYDVIFCRNVLIYFDSAKQQTVMKTLNRLLEAEGYLFVGPAEAFLATRSGFRSVNRTMSFAFSKAGRDSAQPIEFPRPPRKETQPTRSTLGKAPVTMITAKAAERFFQKPAIAEAVNLQEVERLADIGRLEEASRLCEQYLRKQGPSSQAYYLLGLMKDATGDLANATDNYRKVLYLEPDHPDALIHLALLCERQGDLTGAERLRARARRADRSAKP